MHAILDEQKLLMKTEGLKCFLSGMKQKLVIRDKTRNKNVFETRKRKKKEGGLVLYLPTVNFFEEAHNYEGNRLFH